MPTVQTLEGLGLEEDGHARGLVNSFARLRDRLQKARRADNCVAAGQWIMSARHQLGEVRAHIDSIPDGDGREEALRDYRSLSDDVGRETQKFFKSCVRK